MIKSRQKKYDESMKAKGYCKPAPWVPVEYKDDLINYAKKLRKQRERKGK